MAPRFKFFAEKSCLEQNKQKIRLTFTSRKEEFDDTLPRTSLPIFLNIFPDFATTSSLSCDQSHRKRLLITRTRGRSFARGGFTLARKREAQKRTFTASNTSYIYIYTLRNDSPERSADSHSHHTNRTNRYLPPGRDRGSRNMEQVTDISNKITSSLPINITLPSTNHCHKS